MEKFEDLLGKTLASVKNEGDELIFTLDTGEKYKLFHRQVCCESVYIEDVAGDLDDLIGSPLLMAEEATSDENPEGVDMEYLARFMWTFYKLATIKGYVTVRWFGESNGYYSEEVDFVAIEHVNNT